MLLNVIENYTDRICQRELANDKIASMAKAINEGS